LEHLELAKIECEGYTTIDRRDASARSTGRDQDRKMAEVEEEQTQDAFREGLFVRALGRPCSANPYPQNSSQGLLWEKGWRLVDEDGENAPPTGAISLVKLVPEFTPGVAPTEARREPTKSFIAIFRPTVRIVGVLRIVAVIAMGILMLMALRW
jgi:hypothetical protein